MISEDTPLTDSMAQRAVAEFWRRLREAQDYDETWGDAMNEMSERTNDLFGQALAVLEPFQPLD